MKNHYYYIETYYIMNNKFLDSGQKLCMGKTHVRNILFIDKSLNDQKQIYKSVNRNTVVVEYDVFNTKRKDLTDAIDFISKRGSKMNIDIDLPEQKYRI